MLNPCLPTPVMHSNPLLPLRLPSRSLAPLLPRVHGEDRSLGRPAAPGGWVFAMQVQGWLESERGGESSIVGLDSTLSPLEHPLMGKPTDNHTS
ncbi:hypothetical protein Q5P01_015159 [Channa striata]|uniref:Uncharacterized protein n=1 Tax=Channa striata TaxID=64152 RepID=A0AA88MK36_CHASR|nr:hypothetical protein Q5P01_015159 [Channa striata]